MFISGGVDMAKIYKNVTELIGGTPLLEVKNIEAAENLEARISKSSRQC